MDIVVEGVARIQQKDDASAIDPSLLVLREILVQEYAGNGARFSAGHVERHPWDTMYLCLERPDEETTCLLFRPDEMSIISWLCSGVLWSWLISGVEQDKPLLLKNEDAA